MKPNIVYQTKRGKIRVTREAGGVLLHTHLRLIRIREQTVRTHGLLRSVQLLQQRAYKERNKAAHYRYTMVLLMLLSIRG